jgi:hypothetical protein
MCIRLIKIIIITSRFYHSDIWIDRIQGCARAEGEAVFELNGLSINPSSISVGDTLTVSVDCHNIGNEAGSHTVTLIIDGEVEDEKTVKLEPDGTTSVSFEVLTSEEGVYSCEVNGLSGNFEVKKAQTGIPGFPFIAILTALVIYYLLRESEI